MVVIYRITAPAHYLAYYFAYYLVHYLVYYLVCRLVYYLVHHPVYYFAVASFLLMTQPAAAVAPAAVVALVLA